MEVLSWSRLWGLVSFCHCYWLQKEDNGWFRIHILWECAVNPTVIMAQFSLWGREIGHMFKVLRIPRFSFSNGGLPGREYYVNEYYGAKSGAFWAYHIGLPRIPSIPTSHYLGMQCGKKNLPLLCFSNTQRCDSEAVFPIWRLPSNVMESDLFPTPHPHTHHRKCHTEYSQAARPFAFCQEYSLPMLDKIRGMSCHWIPTPPRYYRGFECWTDRKETLHQVWPT